MGTFERIWLTLVDEFSDLSEIEQITRTGLRLCLAVLLGGVLGYERENQGKAAGLRTHMLVTLGAAMFVMAIREGSAQADAVSRVIQGIAAGIGFLCAGTILKGSRTSEVKGLTTAAGLWLSTAIGISVGLGHSATAMLGTLLALLVLHWLPGLAERNHNTADSQGDDRHVP
ncbi:MgtC/SapB family protein [Pseudomonas sp. ZM23]|uniref:Protein MgtC n=1 Tax=Pseudomonas triclosanedens TaxID=2961893 RepID=A0ABY7A5H6_9PSED|nr:MgtC/SapB family protein [Pseudomonas triclosanedens]MCP8466249.1 MgtC/SapB family protein [Pseudomonas triclosanedens]MCP8471775.1 MgtC/SapB family protein [Pseudomonas triclosanedens]MCP8478872.1 MgtC/SapB family protein [Pseudomonas triclosanedens]WAI52333.1 MgtC/SapB family protein [Pseudomonas triclosanedens]